MTRTSRAAGPALMRFEVTHRDYGTALVSSIGADSATMAAARAWGVAEKWGQIAGYCDVRKLGPARKPRCRRCGDEFGKAGDEDGLCPFCQQAEEISRREKGGRAPDRRAPDRRAGCRKRK